MANFTKDLDDLLSREFGERPEWQLARLEYDRWLETPMAEAVSALNQKVELLRRAVDIFSPRILQDDHVINLVTRDLPPPGDQVMIPLGAGRSELMRIIDREVNERLEVVYVLERSDGSRFRYLFVD